MLQRRSPLFLLLVCCVLTRADAFQRGAANNKPIARVNGQSITEGDYEFELISRRIKPPVPPEERKKIVERLVDQELMYQFLRSQEVKPDLAAVTAQMKSINDYVTQAGKDPKEVLGQLGYTEGKLRSRLEFASMREAFLNKMIGEEQLLQYFEKHREQFDDTRYRARKIFIALPADATDEQVKAVEQQLLDYRKQIADGKITFEEAAKKWSQAPSAKDGGDIGFFPYRSNRTSAEFSAKAFQQKLGELGQPFRDHYGMHLVQLIEVLPGQFSLEDVRGQVKKQLHTEFWNSIVEKQRSQAKIEMFAD